MTAPDSDIATIRQHIQTSYTEILQLVNGPLADLKEEQLYIDPEAEEWTLMENLAHIVEFMSYWADEIAKLVATPGHNFGRTMQHEGRLRAISEHGADRLEQVRQDLPTSYAHLDRVLGTLKGGDLELRGHHSKFGEQSLAWFIDEFVTHHLAAHADQMKRGVEALTKNSNQDRLI